MTTRRGPVSPWWSTLLVVLALFLPAVAQAQYKNTIFGLDAGYWLSTKPSTMDGNTILSGSARPLRLPGALRIGGESDIKMDEDHWWFVGRVNLAVFINPGSPAGCADTTEACLNAKFDELSDKAIGDIFGLQGSIGVRYVFLTDRFQPYLQFALSYMRLFTFTDLSGSSCEGGSDPLMNQFCASGTYEDAFLPHPNVGGVHIQPGAQFLIARDMALHLFVDSQWWIIFNARTNFAFVFGAGLNFFT